MLVRARLRRTSSLAKINVSVKRHRIIALTSWRNITVAVGFPVQVTSAALPPLTCQRTAEQSFAEGKYVLSLCTGKHDMTEMTYTNKEKIELN
jgi:hypothetical protein